MAGFRLTALAKADLRGVAAYTQARWGVEQRNRYIKQFDDAFRWLAERPMVGKDCSAVRAGYRKFPQGSHLILNREGAGSGIEIIRILHRQMDVKARL